MIYPELSRTILGIAMQLHREMGCGFKKKVYQDAFEVLLKENKIPYEKEKHISLVFHGVLSKGIHELSEEECLEYFSVVREIIELILDEREFLRQQEEKKKRARSNLSKLAGKLKG